MSSASRPRQYKGLMGGIVTCIAVGMSVYHILYISHALDRVGIHLLAVPHRAATLTFLVALSFLLLPAKRDTPRDRLPWYDAILLLIGIAGPLYIALNYEKQIDRWAIEKFYLYEYAFTFATILVVLEMARRVAGLAMPVLAVFFLIHMVFGNHFPGFLYSSGTSLSRFSALMMYGNEGILGSVMGVASTVIIMFVIFAQFLFLTPAGQFIIDISLATLGHVRGGPAKVAVVASALFGTLSGSPTANVAATGTFTIPMMKRIGYKPEFAGAVEAAASTGGNLMPPVMGIIAFIMADWLGISYWAVCVAALFPSLLYYLSIFVSVDAEAIRLGLRGVPRSECPSIKKTLRDGWTSVLPVIALVIFLAVLQFSAQYAGLLATGVLIIVGVAQRKKRLGIRQLVTGLRGGGTGMLVAGNSCACAGIIVGALAVTQLGLSLSSVIVTASGGNLIILLLLTAALCFMLGMGMAGIPAYIMVAFLVAPALVKMGVPILAAHLFIFYWIMVHFISPPVAPAVFVACALADSSPWKTGWIAVRLAIVALVVPFFFALYPVLILKGPPDQIAIACVTAIPGVVLLAWGMFGYSVIGKANWTQRTLFMLGGLALMLPPVIFDAIGLVASLPAVLWQLQQKRSSILLGKLQTG